MKRLVRTLALALLPLLAAPAGAAPGTYPAASPADLAVPFGQQTHAFRYVLNDLRFQPVKDVGELARDPDTAILIVFGDVAVLDRVPGGLGNFVKNGGALLVATDRAVRSGPLVDHFGVRVDGRAVRLMAGDAPQAYRGLEECPFAQPIPDAKEPVFKNLRPGVATNRPSFLSLETRRGRMLTVLATLPPGATYPEKWVRGGFAVHLSGPRFAAARDWDRGRVLVLADHSVFINAMMLQPDNSNIDLAYNCLEWLSGPDRRRTRVLLADEGTVVPDFHVVMKETPLPPIKPPPDPVAFANRALDALGKENLLNQEILSRVPPYALYRWAALALTAGLLLYGFCRLARSRHRVEPGAPLLAAAVAKLAPAGGALEQRHDALVVEGNLAEPARELARQFFASVGGVSAERPPVPRFTGALLERKHLRQAVRRLWELAYSAAPVRVSREEFAGLAARIEAVRSALERGALTLA